MHQAFLTRNPDHLTHTSPRSRLDEHDDITSCVRERERVHSFMNNTVLTTAVSVISKGNNYYSVQQQVYSLTKQVIFNFFMQRNLQNIS